MDQAKLKELLYQSLETEKGGVLVYETALRCVVNEELKNEWTKYLEQTKTHVTILEGIFDTLGFDSDEQTSGSEIVEFKGASLVKAMEKALAAGAPEAAQLVAAECVVDAETKDHLNWELLGEAAKELEGEQAEALRDAFDKVEEQEDEHLYHTMGWSRELWFQFLGLPAVLPPPEEKRHVDTAAGAARAKSQRGRMLRRAGPRRVSRRRKAVKTS